MNAKLSWSLNGKPVSVETDPRRSLLEVLREDLDLTGTKYGCGEGQCRACTVLVDGEAVPSCLTEVASVEGKEVRTIEGLAGEKGLHPVQRAFLAAGAMQCGTCVPGMILETVAQLEKHPRAGETELARALAGHICRCCGYPNILEALRLVAGRRAREVK